MTAIGIRKAGRGKLYDGGGLMIERAGDSGKWIFRYSHLGRRREMGLGTWPTVSLADARAARDRWAGELAAGRDPISVREDQRAAEIAGRDREDPTFAAATQMVFDSIKATMRGDGTRGRWMSPMSKHVLPQIGTRRLSRIRQHHISDALAPIWQTKHPTAIKCLNRIRIVLRESRLMGYQTDPFFADAAERILGEVRHRPTRIPSTPWREIPALYARLPDTVGGDALRLLVLTAVRMDGVTGIRSMEIEDDIWTVPEDRIKGVEGRVQDFRVPLSGEALRVIDRRRSYAGADHLLPGLTGRPITSAAVAKALTVLGETGRPHGLRTSIRTWIQDNRICDRDVAETILGHVIGSEVERAYARSDLLDLRRPVMEAWARFVTGEAAAEVIQMGERRAK